MPEIKKHIVRVGKSEIHLFPVEHTMDDYQKRRWIGIKPVLKSISPDFDAIALEGKTDEGFREELGRALYSKKKFREPEEKLIRKKVVKDNIKLLVIDAIKTEESVRDRETDKKALFASIQIPTRGKRGKLREDWKVDFSEKEFRDVMMTSNLLKAIKAMEEQKDAVKVALIAHPAHIVSIERYLRIQKIRELGEKPH